MASVENKIIDQVDKRERKNVCRKNINKEWLPLKQNIVQTVEYEKLTSQWIGSKKSDKDFKVLKIIECPSIVQAATRLFELKDLCLNSLNRLFVLVIDTTEKCKTPTSQELSLLSICFDKPMLLQLTSTVENSEIIYGKGISTADFEDISKSSYIFTQDLKKMLKRKSSFSSDILTAKISQKIKNSTFGEEISSNVLCLRVLNLFGDCQQIMPWLQQETVLIHKSLNLFLAFIDYPSNYDAAVELAWQSKQFEYLEIFLNYDCRFPKEFNLDNADPNFKFRLENVVNQRRNLHRSIIDLNFDEVKKFASETKDKRLKVAYNEINDSAIVTALRNFHVDMYAFLIEEGFEFCRESEGVLKELPDDQKSFFKDKNFELCTPFVAGPGEHPLMSCSSLSMGHSSKDFYFRKVRKLFNLLENIPEVVPILRIAEHCKDLKIIFDFKRKLVGFTNPKEMRTFDASGAFFETSKVIVVCLGCDFLEGAATLIHELTHLAMDMMYGNNCNPFGVYDSKRSEEFKAITAEYKRFFEGQTHDPVFDGMRQIFEYYEEDEIEGELIVQVLQMLVAFSESPEDVAEWKSVCAKLFDFYFKYIPDDIATALKNEGNTACMKTKGCLNYVLVLGPKLKQKFKVLLMILWLTNSVMLAHLLLAILLASFLPLNHT